jgi:hypothetical protein
MHASPVGHSVEVAQSWKLVRPVAQGPAWHELVTLNPLEIERAPQQTSPVVVQDVALVHPRLTLASGRPPLDELLPLPDDDAPPLDELLLPSVASVPGVPPLVLELQAAASVPAIETATKIIILFILTNLPDTRDCPRDGAEFASLLCHGHK